MMTTAQQISEQPIRGLLKEVYDPEIPVLTITDLGILRDIKKVEDTFVIFITPTYSGCPAMDMISMNIRLKMAEAGITNYRIESRLSPAWTTEWMTEGGKQKLKEFGIAPPQPRNGEEDLETLRPPCPQCGSQNTELISSFGSTACKALFRCKDCGEPFDYFKCH